MTGSAGLADARRAALARTSRVVTTTGLSAVAVVFALLAWQRRWITDDALIIVRVVRQILAGAGPVFNAGERAEPHTSTLWTWLVAGAADVTQADVARIAVALGGALSVLGLVVAMDATRRWVRGRGETAPLVPCAALVMLGMFPFWDFATSGLETGLTTFWLAACWWLLVVLRLRPREPATGDAVGGPRGPLIVAAVFGLGPLVRPELAVASAGFLAGGYALTRPRRRAALALAGAAIALPLGYEIARAGYYGTLVPLPALVKSASGTEWVRGVRYVWHFVHPYTLWVPGAVLVTLFGIALARRAWSGGDRIVVAVPIAIGLVLILYTVRVGGDFMHARMLLAPTFILVAPALVIPLRRATAPALAIVAGWALVTASSVRGYPGFSWYGDWDERASYVRFTGDNHPLDTRSFLQADPATASYRAARDAGLPPQLIWDGNGARVPLGPEIHAPVVVAAGRLGTAGAVVPLDGLVADLLGLANPLGARITRTHPGRTGHEKQLPWAWLLAEFADPALTDQPFDPATTPDAIRAARHALTCGALAELRAATRDPLSIARFWANLTGAIERTRLVIPADPIAAERAFCPPP